MNFSLKAGALASALTLAATAMRANKKLPATPVRVVAADDSVSVTCTDNTIAIAATAPAIIREPGRVAVSAERLAALTAGFAAGATVTMSTTESSAQIVCENSRYRLPIIPNIDLAPLLAIVGGEISRVEIGGGSCLSLFDPLSAAADEETRYCLCGIFLHTVGDKLVAVCTDGVRLIRVAIPGANFSITRDLILPAKPAATLRKLVQQTRPDLVTLRRSRTLLCVSAPGFEFTSRLIDGKFPNYEAVVPAASPKAVTCVRVQLLAALSRLVAVATVDPPLLALSWTNAGPLKLFLARQPDDGSDSIAAEVNGVARFAVPLHQLTEMIADFKGERVRLEAAGPLMIQSEGGTQKLALLMPSAWNFGDHSEKEDRLAKHLDTARTSRHSQKKINQ